MARANDADHPPAANDADRATGLRLPRAFCPVCGAEWDDPRERCPNTDNHPTRADGEQPEAPAEG